MINFIGWLATFSKILSMISKDQKRLRYFYMIGCAFNIIYSIGIKAWPVLLCNVILLCENIYCLFIRK